MINTVVLQGRITHTPELKSISNGTPVCSFQVATQRSYVKAGEERKTDFFDVVAWRNTAEFICRNFEKGQQIGITGHLQTSEYTARDGSTRRKVEIYADNIDFMGDRRPGNIDIQQKAENAPQVKIAALESEPPAAVAEFPPDYTEFTFSDAADLPF